MLFFKLFRKKAISRVSLGATKTRGPFVFMVRCSSCKENYFKRERRREGFSNGKLSYDQPDDQLTEIRSSPPVVMYMKVYINKVFNWEFRNHQQDWPPTGEGEFFPGVTNNLPQKILGQPGLLGIPPPTLSFCGQHGGNSSNSFSQSLVNITCASQTPADPPIASERWTDVFKLSKNDVKLALRAMRFMGIFIIFISFLSDFAHQSCPILTSPTPRARWKPCLRTGLGELRWFHQSDRFPSPKKRCAFFLQNKDCLGMMSQPPKKKACRAWWKFIFEWQLGKIKKTIGPY